MRTIRTRVVAPLLLLAFVAGACAQQPSAPGPQAAKLKDTIVVGMSQEPETMIVGISSMLVASTVFGAIYADLTRRNDKNEYIPQLATQTPTLENGGAKLTKTADGKDQLTVTYKLKDNIKFQNGDPVTAEDVKFGWDWTLEKGIPWVDTTTAEQYQAVNVKDPKTVEVVYKPGELDPLYFSYCCTIMSKKALAGVDPKKFKDHEYTRKPIYAGMYKLVDWAPGSAITVEAFDAGWAPFPKTKTIVFKFITDTNTLLAQARAGQVDIVTSDGTSLDQSPEFDKLPSEAGVTPYYVAATTFEHIDFNLNDPKDPKKPHPILADKRVRQAIAHGIDRDKITKQILYGKTKPIHTYYASVSWAAAPDSELTVYNYDPNKAKQLLEDAGWKVGADGIREKAGARLELKLQSTSGNRLRDQTTQVMANDLKAVGIKINIELIPSTKLFATKGEGPINGRTYDIVLFAWSSGDDPQTYLYMCDYIPSKENNWRGQNNTGYCNTEYDKFQKDANNRLKREERKPLYIQAQKVWSADLPVLSLYQRLNVYLARTNLKNFRPAPTSTSPAWNSYEWELPAP